MKIELKKEFKEKIRKLSEELGITNTFNLKCNYEDFYAMGEYLPIQRTQFFELEIKILIPDDMIEVINE